MCSRYDSWPGRPARSLVRPGVVRCHGRRWLAHDALVLRDPSVGKQKLAAGTIRRVWGFAKPYRRHLTVFLVTVVLDALVSVATPLLFRSLIDTALPQKRPRPGLRHRARRRRPRDRRRRPLAGPALVLRADRRGPHLRHAHQGLRPRPADADRVLHPHPDRRARSAGSTTTCSARSRRSPTRCPAVVSNVDRRRITLVGDVLPVLADHPGVAGPAAGLRAPGRWVGRRLQAITRESLRPQRRDEHHDDRALQRLRRAAGQAVRPPRRGGASRSPAGPAGCATSASRRRCTAGCSSPR